MAAGAVGIGANVAVGADDLDEFAGANVAVGPDDADVAPATGLWDKTVEGDSAGVPGRLLQEATEINRSNTHDNLTAREAADR